MKIMEAVWPLTALYAGPLGLAAYYRWGRPMSLKWMEARNGGMQGKPFWAGTAIRLAAKADFLALSAFEVGLFGWMAIMQLVLFASPGLPTDSAAFWFLMQVGMLIGFVTTYPVNWWLIRRGIKEIM
jgi:hypothetical protein